MANQSLCSVPECGKPHLAKGFCNAHYRRLKRHGDALAGNTPRGEPQKFYAEVVLVYEGDECLIWPYSRVGHGYGLMTRDGDQQYTHRLLCEDVYGPPPTPRHDAAHSCGKGHDGCVTKGHLLWKTRAANMADKLDHGTHHRGERHGQSKLTEKQVREIKSLKGVETKTALAKKFGVSWSAVSNIHSGRNWGWLPD